MSIKLMSAAWDIPLENGGDKFVLVSLSDQANDDGVCWPSIKTIAGRCCMSERSVTNHIRNLEKLGLLSVESGGGRFSNRYKIELNGPMQNLQGTPATVARHPCNGFHAPLQNLPCTPATVANDPKYNPNITQIEPLLVLEAEASDCEAASTEEFLKAWNDMASATGLPKCRDFGPKRLKSFRSLRKQDFFCRNWREALLRISRSDFCLGKKTAWRADIDWFLQQNVVTKIMEGKYDNRDNPQASHELVRRINIIEEQIRNCKGNPEFIGYDRTGLHDEEYELLKEKLEMTKKTYVNALK